MTSTHEEDLALIIEKRRADERRFLIRSLDHESAPRIAPAMNAIRDLLADGKPHPFAEVIAAGVRESDLAVKTIAGMLRRAAVAGFIDRKGSWTPGGKGSPGRDTRWYTLVAWPDKPEGGR